MVIGIQFSGAGGRILLGLLLGLGARAVRLVERHLQLVDVALELLLRLREGLEKCNSAASHLVISLTLSRRNLFSSHLQIPVQH